MILKENDRVYVFDCAIYTLLKITSILSHTDVTSGSLSTISFVVSRFIFSIFHRTIFNSSISKGVKTPSPKYTKKNKTIMTQRRIPNTQIVINSWYIFLKSCFHTSTKNIYNFYGLRTVVFQWILQFNYTCKLHWFCVFRMRLKSISLKWLSPIMVRTS